MTNELAIRILTGDTLGTTEQTKEAVTMAVRALSNVVERKKGKWILADVQRQEDVDNGNYRFICSECGKADIHSKAVTVSFCWNCGADMREEKNDGKDK